MAKKLEDLLSQIEKLRKLEAFNFTASEVAIISKNDNVIYLYKKDHP